MKLMCIFHKIIILLCTNLFVILKLFSISDLRVFMCAQTVQNGGMFCKQTGGILFKPMKSEFYFDRRLLHFIFNISQLILIIVIFDIYCKKSRCINSDKTIQIGYFIVRDVIKSRPESITSDPPCFTMVLQIKHNLTEFNRK